MRAASFASLPESLRAELAEASSALSSLAPVSPEAIDAAPDERFGALRHELSAHYLALRVLGRHSGRSRFEARALAAFEAGAGALGISSPGDFRDRLAALNHSLAGGKGGWRGGFVRLSDDRAGNRIYFPHVSAVPGQLEELRLFLSDRTGAPPLFTAAVACLLLLNCHPFAGGNGRTARALFNHLLRRGGMPRDVYLPLYEIARRAHGGYEIALRIAELRGDWTPFLRWLLDALCCCRDLTSTTQAVRLHREPSPAESIESAATRSVERNAHGRAALLEGADQAGPGLDPGGNLFGDQERRDHRLQPDPRAHRQEDQI